MLIRLKASPLAAEAFAGIPEEAKKALAMRLEEEQKAFARWAEKVAKEAAKNFFAEKAEEAAKAFANSVEEATKTFARKAPSLIDDCVEAREIDAGKLQAEVERLRKTPSAEKMWTNLAELAIHIGALDAHDIEAIRMMASRLAIAGATTNTSDCRIRAAATSWPPARRRSPGLVIRASSVGEVPPRTQDRQVRH